LRNVLLLILTGHYQGDEAPLGCLVAPTVCEGLLALLRKSGDPLGNLLLTSVKDINRIPKVTWALCSPWSKSLYRELGTLLESNEKTLSKTQIILRKQLSLGGKALMEKARVRVNAISQLILILIPLQLENAKGRVEEDIEGGNGPGAMTYLYFKGHIVPVVGR
jgi:hypothetical protein